MNKRFKIDSLVQVVLLSVLSTLIFSCGKQKAELVEDTGTDAYVDSTMELPRLIFADGQVSLNDRCMVRLNKLNRKMPPIYVNGKPLGFC